MLNKLCIESGEFKSKKNSLSAQDRFLLPYSDTNVRT